MTTIEVKSFVKSRNEIKSCSAYRHRPPNYIYFAPFTEYNYECPLCNHKTVVAGKSIINVEELCLTKFSSI